MVPEDDHTKQDLEILKALDNALQHGRWERSLFFQAMGKQLRDLREEFKQLLGLEEANQSDRPSISHTAERIAENHGLIEIYISLYVSGGSNIKKWEGVLNTLGGYSISRPIYKNENDIKEAIRAKEFQENDAYTAIFIQENEIIKPFNDKTPLDRNGRELLVIKEGSIRVENIKRFVHVTGVYSFINGRLIRKGNHDFAIVSNIEILGARFSCSNKDKYEIDIPAFLASSRWVRFFACLHVFIARPKFIRIKPS